MIGWMIFVGLIFISVMVGLYLRVVYCLWFIKDIIIEVFQRVLFCCRKRVIKMVIVVMFIYVLCWVFEFLIYFLGFIGFMKLIYFYYGIVLSLIVFNLSINFVIYSFQSSIFRCYVFDFICCK